MNDLFQTYSNKYVTPSLPACANESDQLTFEFLNGKQAGIVDGNKIISSFYLGDVLQEIDSWVQQSKILYPGELVYIQGLSKGLSKRFQYFPFDGSVSYTGINHLMYMTVDMSINYLSGFKTNELNLSISSDPTYMINIYNAINSKFGELGIHVNCSYDPSSLKFLSLKDGYMFNITNIDVSLWEPLQPQYRETLVEDLTKSIPFFKYPNSAMLGYVIKVTYPEDVSSQDCWIKLNHIPEYIDYYQTLDNSTYTKSTKYVDVGLSEMPQDSSILNAEQYLQWVENNNMWQKLGQIKIWLSAPDPIDNIQRNLINGFYVYNPQEYNVKIDYLVIE